MACACHNMGAAEIAIPDRFVNIERVLLDYMKGALQSGAYFYLTPQLNSDAITMADVVQGYRTAGFADSGRDGSETSGSAGFWSSVVDTAKAIGNTVVAVLPSIATLYGTSQQLKAQYNASNAGASLNSQGVTVPPALAPYLVNAARQDVTGLTGISSSTLLLFGGAILLMMAVSK